MARMTKEERALRKAENDATVARLHKLREEAIAIVATGKCPQCQRKLRYNSSITGWWQCSQYGNEMFRAEPDKSSCSFQCFTE